MTREEYLKKLKRQSGDNSSHITMETVDWDRIETEAAEAAKYDIDYYQMTPEEKLLATIFGYNENLNLEYMKNKEGIEDEK